MSQVTVQDLLRKAEDIDVVRLDYMAKTDNLNMHDDGRLDAAQFNIVHGTTVPNPQDPAPVNLTTHGLGQLSDKLGIKYGRAFFNNNPTVPTDIKASLFNHFLGENPNKDLLIRTYGDYARGVLSDKYLIMDHAWVIRQALEFLTDRNSGDVVPHVVVPNYRLDADYMSFTVIVRADNPNGGSDGTYGYGVNIRNGTVGNSSTNVARAFLRHACLNSVYERRIEWAVRHLGGSEYLAQRESTIIAAIGSALKASEDLVNRMIRSRRQRLPNVFDVITAMSEAQGLPENLIPTISAGTEQENSLFGLVNGFSYAATHGEGLEDDVREDLSALSGQLLTQFGDGETEGDALAKLLFAEAGTKAHVSVTVDG